MSVMYLAPWQLSFNDADAIKGKSKTCDILNTIRNFLTADGYRSETSPLDVLFNAPPGTTIEPFSVGHSVGFGKSLACQLIVLAGARKALSDEEVAWLLPAFTTMRRLQATFDPAGDVEAQVLRSLSTKMHMTNRQRPDALQLALAFGKSVTSKIAAGDTKSRKDILSKVIDNYNAKVGSKGCRIHTEERAAINLLDSQTPKFIERLKRHWQCFQVVESAVPVTVLNNAFLRSNYSPPVTAKENPTWFRILSPSVEKNEEWLERLVTAFTIQIDSKKAAGKAPSLRGGGASLFRDQDPGQVHQLACLWVSIRDEVKASVTSETFAKLVAMFRRGALDRELLEKVKVRDPQFDLSGFRFLMSAQQDTMACVQAQGKDSLISAELAVKKANFNLWKHTLENEGKKFSSFLEARRRVVESNALSDSTFIDNLHQLVHVHTENHADIFYPVFEASSEANVGPKVEAAVQKVADSMGHMKDLVYRVYVANLTYLGASWNKAIRELTHIVANKLSVCPERSVALVIMPNVGARGDCHDDIEIAKAHADIRDMMGDVGNDLAWRSIGLYISMDGMYSQDRSGHHEMLMVISRQTVPVMDGAKKSVKHKSNFANSFLWKRRRVSEAVQLLQRKDFVNPLAPLQRHDVRNLSVPQELKQHFTGVSLYTQIFKDLWQDMPVNRSDVAVYVDICPYDESLTSAVVQARMEASMALPQGSAVSAVWVADTTSDKSKMVKYVSSAVRTLIYREVMEKKYKMPAISDESFRPPESQEVPRVKESDYKVTKPQNNLTLPILQTCYDERSGLEGIDAEFQEAVRIHNAKFNPLGVPWKGDQKRTQPEEPSETPEELAQPLCATLGDPATKEDAMAKYGAGHVVQHTQAGVELVVFPDGQLFIWAPKEPVILNMQSPLGLLRGEFKLGTEAAQVADKPNVLWAIEDDQVMVQASTEPAYTPKCPMAPVTLQTFLLYLASQKQISVEIANHKCKRAGDHFEISPEQECRYLIHQLGNKEKVTPQNMANLLDLEKVQTSEKVQLLMRVKYCEKRRAVEPGRFALYLRKPVRVAADTLVRLL